MEKYIWKKPQIDWAMGVPHRRRRISEQLLSVHVIMEKMRFL